MTPPSQGGIEKTAWQHTWKALEAANLLDQWGDQNFVASSIPYPTQFGVSVQQQTSLAEFMMNSTINSSSSLATHENTSRHNNHHRVQEPLEPLEPLYIFASFRPNCSGCEERAQAASCLTSHFLKSILGDVTDSLGYPASFPGKLRTSKMVYNYQFALEANARGSPLHAHLAAYNLLFYGSKRWFLLPPYHQAFSNKPISSWAAQDAGNMLPVVPTECTQQAGDIMFVPHGWTHAVLNQRAAVAIAMEIDSYTRTQNPI